MLDFASVCVNAKNPENHDALGILEEEYCACFAVADGKDNAQLAELAVNTVLSDFKEQNEITTATMPHFFDHMQNTLLSHQQSRAIAGGTAAAVLLTDGSIAVWAHIGDCRIYHLQDHLLYEITADHSDAYARYEAGQIRYPKIRTDRTRRNLTHLMGPGQDFAPAFSAPSVVRRNDSFLICTDGFWENIHEKQIEKTLRRSKCAQDWLSRMQKIVDNNRSTRKYTHASDDYTAITVCI